MIPAEPEEGFKVIDRRRRDSAEDVAEVSAVAADTDRQPDLTGLFMMLANSAVYALEEQQDAEQAAQIIEVLVLLRHKTEGHRTPEETETLESATYDMQVRYAEATKRTG